MKVQHLSGQPCPGPALSRLPGAAPPPLLPHPPRPWDSPPLRQAAHPLWLQSAHSSRAAPLLRPLPQPNGGRRPSRPRALSTSSQQSAAGWGASSGDEELSAAGTATGRGEAGADLLVGVREQGLDGLPLRPRPPLRVECGVAAGPSGGDTPRHPGCQSLRPERWEHD